MCVCKREYEFVSSVLLCAEIHIHHYLAICAFTNGYVLYVFLSLFVDLLATVSCSFIFIH